MKTNMASSTKTARIVGILFIAATAASIIGSAFINPILDNANYLTQLTEQQNRLITGALFQFIAAFASAGIAISLYSVLKQHSEGLALGAVSFRLIEGVFYLVGALCLLALLSLSDQLLSAGGQDTSTFQAIGHLLLAVSDLAGFVLGVLAFCLGGMMYYIVFYQARLVPRWLSVWGMVALVLLLAAMFLTLFDGEPYSVSGNLLFLALPIALQEIVLALWLIIKGFNTSAPTSESVKAVRTFA